MDDLVTWLRKQIDEDERVAREAAQGPWRVDDESYAETIEAKRRILDEHHPIDPCDAHDASLRSITCETVRLLALPYADRPGYRDEWRP